MLHLRHSGKKLSFLSRQFITSTQRFSSSTSKSGENVENIEIPNYIKRSPTDILRALSGTVGFDPTAPHYKYHDDPFLIPTSNSQKRIYALAQESGRKSAKWIRQTHADLFQHKEADPPIEAFIPTKVYTEESTVELKDLEKLIENSEVQDAILVYELLQKSGAEVSPELKQSFFEMLCYYNCDEPLDDDLIEERWFKQSEKGKERFKKTWKDGGLAEQIFDSFEEKSSQQYSTIIRGMCKYFQVDRAWALLNDALAKNIQVDVECYNSILNVSNFLKESTELRWEFLQEVLNLMKSQNVQPNLGTFNGALNAVRNMGGKMIREYCLTILAEFKQIGIEPSLASWNFVLSIFCRERGPVSHVLIDIMNEIEGKEFTMRDHRDVTFFTNAMDVARNHVNDVNLARRVNDLLHVGDNYNLIGDSIKESVYYRNYFMVILANEPFESFMETYYQLVPNVYVPEPAIMEEILKTVERTGAIEHIPLFWSNMVQFDHVSRENLLDLITRIMVENPPNEEVSFHQGLTEKFAIAAYDMWSKIEERNETRTTKQEWTGKLLSDILLLICNNKDFVKATAVFNMIVQSQDKIIGEPGFDSLEKFVRLCIEKKDPNLAILCLQLCNDIGFNETKQVATEIVIGFTLDGSMLKKIGSIVGIDTVELAAQEKQNLREQKLHEIQQRNENETK